MDWPWRQLLGVLVGASLASPALLARAQVREEAPEATRPEAAPGPLTAPPGQVCGPSEAGCFLEVDGQWRSAHATYRRSLLERDPSYWRAAGEMVLFLGIGTAWYWIERDRNAFDWDFQGWRQRFDEESYRFDNNPFQVNFMGHALSGLTYYGMSRANDLGVLASFAYTFMASWMWEFVIEFKERVSINDQIVTPMAGMAVGEFFYKLSRYVTSAPGGGGRKHRALKWSVGLGVAAHDWLDGRAPPHEDLPADERGFGTDISARFRFAYGAGAARPSEGAQFAVHELAFDGTLVSLPGYLRPGHYGLFFTDANVSSMRVRLRFASEGRGGEMDGDAILLGYHRQAIAEGRRGQWGQATTVGMNVSYLYRREEYDAFVDRLAITGLPGLALDVHLFAGPALFRIGARLNGDFAGVHSQAYPAWDVRYPGEHPKTILRREQYYYGWGGTGRWLFEVRLPYVELGAAVRYGAWRSQEGLDRSQADVTVDVRARDRALDVEAWLRVVPFDFGLFLEASCELRRRWSWVESFTADRELVRYQLSVGVLR
jgi:hypothetical protein